MADMFVQKPFLHSFLSDFVFIPETMTINSEEILILDKELSEYEQIFLNPDIEKSLISKNELLASFAISKAEGSQLTITEARQVYETMISDPKYDFLAQKLKKNKSLNQKDHDRLEFLNIAQTFRNLNQEKLSIDDLTPQLIISIHRQLTTGLDIFAKYLPDFTVYKSGLWRDNDLIRVGKYIPAPYIQIESGVEELINWLKKNKTISGIAVFHTALYGLHPFNNGNKRLCRILEHLLLRNLINPKNLYSTSYYYHKEKERYYKYLLFSLERKNLNHFTLFVFEAIVLSIISVVTTSLQVKRLEYINKPDIDRQTKIVLQLLIKRHEVQFKLMLKNIKGKMARQTMVNYLSRAVEQKITLKRDVGKTTYYSLNLDVPEIETIKKWLDFAKKKLSYIPDDIRLV